MLERRNPDLVPEGGVSRRAELASRHLDLDSSSPDPDGGQLRASASAPVDVPDQFRKLAELRDEGVLAEEEFQAKKRDPLDRW